MYQSNPNVCCLFPHIPHGIVCCKSGYGCNIVMTKLCRFLGQKKISWLKIGLPEAKLNICWPIDAHSNHKKVHPKNSEIFNPERYPHISMIP